MLLLVYLGGSCYRGSTEELVCFFGWPIHQNYRTVISWTIFAALSPLLFIINYAANPPFYTSFTSYILLHTRLNIALRLPSFSFYKIRGDYISEICARVPPEALSKFYDCINYAANLPFYTSFTSYILLHRLESLHSVSVFSSLMSLGSAAIFLHLQSTSKSNTSPFLLQLRNCILYCSLHFIQVCQ